MHKPRHVEIILLLATFLTFAFISQSIADNNLRPQVFSEHEKALHQDRMQNMTALEKQRYRNDQYEILKQRAAAIGYSMPDTPPWAHQQALEPVKSTEAQESQAETEQARHERQLADYRKASAEKRKAMQEKIEKQRQEIKKRIDRLVQQNAVKPAPQPIPPAMPAYQPRPYPMPPAYPGYYMPPPMPGYRY